MALANLRYLTRHRNKLLKNATQLGEYFLARLSRMSFKGKATIHGKGFAIGIEVEDESTPPRSATPAAKTACSSPPKKTSSCSSPP